MQSAELVITSSDAFMRVPPRHGSGAADPEAQKYPRGQRSHAVAPADAWNVPASHWTHALSPLLAAIVPGAQMVAFVAPRGHATLVSLVGCVCV